MATRKIAMCKREYNFGMEVELHSIISVDNIHRNPGAWAAKKLPCYNIHIR